MLFIKTFLDLHCRVCDKEKCRNMKIHCQETGHCNCLSVNCNTYCTILRHKVDDLGFRTYEKPLCMYLLSSKYILFWPPIYTIHTEIDIDIDCSAGRSRPTFLFYFGDTLEDLLRLKEYPLKQRRLFTTTQAQTQLK